MTEVNNALWSSHVGDSSVILFEDIIKQLVSFAQDHFKARVK